MRKIPLLLGSSAMAIVLVVLATNVESPFRMTAAVPPAEPAFVGAGQVSDSIKNVGQSVEQSESLWARVTSRDQEADKVSPAGEPVHSKPVDAARQVAPGLASSSLQSVSDEALEAPQSLSQVPPTVSGDRFANRPDQGMQEVAQAPVSTFSADTDTASYSAVRRMLEAGTLPPVDAVRTEEMINYFRYAYSQAEDKTRPFQPAVTVYPTPWNPETRLVHIGIKAFEPQTADRPPVNLVLLVDVSGSMDDPTKLPLVRASFGMLIDKLQPTDTVAIVTYAGSSGVALPPTKVENKAQIRTVLDSLTAGGSTAGAAGLETAYDLAKQNFNKEGVNRILLATDGDFNVGVSAPGGLAEYVAQQRSSGVFLSVLGFGMGNYQDTMMQAIAQNGNGVAAYIDSMSEARRVLADQITGTLVTVAKDVKFQVAFSPAQVKSYRLLGYETRALAREDFDNDKVDAGEVGAGHAVTAIYEIVPVPELARNETLPIPGELARLRIRYKLPESATSQLIERPIGQGDTVASVANASADVRFATAVAGFSRLLRHSVGLRDFSYENVITLAESAFEGESQEERRQFVDLVRTAKALDTRPAPAPSKEEGGVAFPVE